jgi:hypothetical protein
MDLCATKEKTDFFLFFNRMHKGPYINNLNWDRDIGRKEIFYSISEKDFYLLLKMEHARFCDGKSIPQHNSSPQKFKMSASLHLNLNTVFYCFVFR